MAMYELGDRDVLHPEEPSVECVNGHVNPADWEYCGDCGAPLFDQHRRKRRRQLLLTMVGALFAVLAIGAVILATKGSHHPAPDESATRRDAIAAWWSAAKTDVLELQNALDDTESAAGRWDTNGVSEGCQRIHDAADVGVPAHLPSPDPTLTAELTAADRDAHEASHMCLAVFAQSRNSYAAEFKAATGQAKMHIAAAISLVEQVITD
jgi:hypothetical protein